jgi:hypothetical protein
MAGEFLGKSASSLFGAGFASVPGGMNVNLWLRLAGLVIALAYRTVKFAD